MSEKRLSWSGNDRDGWTGFFWSASVAWQFRIVPIVGGVAYRLDNPLPNPGYRADREPYFETSDQAKERADTLLREFTIPAAVLANGSYRHQYAENATEYTFANKLYTHDCDGPCDPRDDGHCYSPEAIIMRLIGSDTWIITRPGGRHANHSQEWTLPDSLPGSPGFPGDAFRFTEDEAFNMIHALDENRD
ncbi:hypothetical protein ACIBHY_29505 [Nonomuraea sp. NPDC050547]|uniref:hypothetical protein n=1 Tax=unclassified Nonomuraea TaxID=2593643 RepID=UPI00379A02AC